MTVSFLKRPVVEFGVAVQGKPGAAISRVLWHQKQLIQARALDLPVEWMGERSCRHQTLAWKRRSLLTGPRPRSPA